MLELKLFPELEAVLLATRVNDIVRPRYHLNPQLPTHTIGMIQHRTRAEEICMPNIRILYACPGRFMVGLLT